MRQQRFIPAQPLSRYLHCFWYWEGAPQTHAKEKLLPNGEASVIINLLDDPVRIFDPHDFTRYITCRNAVVSGPRTSCFVIDTDQQERVIGMQFRPGGIFPFLGMPASEIANTSVDLEDIWRAQATILREQLLAAADVPRMFSLLERHLLALLLHPCASHPAVTCAVRQLQSTTGGARIGEVSDQLGLSQRRLIEIFRREVGLPPKAFFRVRRFQKVLSTVHQDRHPDWCQLALDCGYYDQAHFIHDFQSFSGLTPTAYATVAGHHLNHLPLA